MMLAGGLVLVAASLYFLDMERHLDSKPEFSASYNAKVVTPHTKTPTETSLSTTPTETTTTTTPQICILHVSYGEKYISTIDNFTVPIKQDYAQRYGYIFKLHQRPSMEDLLTKDFQQCGISNEAIQSKHRNDHALIKFCGVQTAFDDGCTVVVWTDSDATFVNSGFPVDSWLSQNRDADVFWSVAGPHGFCDTPDSEGCISVSHFTRCVNSGIFIIRNTHWSRRYVRRILERAVNMVPAENWEKSLNHFKNSKLPNSQWELPLACDLDPDNPPLWSQCWAQEPGRLKYGDQCVIACETMENMSSTSVMGHFHCTSSRSFQQVFRKFSASFQHDSSHDIPQDAYFVNCAGGDEEIAQCFRDILEARDAAAKRK